MAYNWGLRKILYSNYNKVTVGSIFAKTYMIPNSLHGGTAIRIQESCTTIYNHDIHATSSSTISSVYSPSMTPLVFHQNNSYCSIQPRVQQILMISLTKSEDLKDESRSSEYRSYELS